MSTTAWKLFYFGIGLECSSPILEAFHHCGPYNPFDSLIQLFIHHGLIYGKSTFKQFLKVGFNNNIQNFTVCHGKKFKGTFVLEYGSKTNVWLFWLQDIDVLIPLQYVTWFVTLARVLDFQRSSPWIQVNRNYY